MKATGSFGFTNKRHVSLFCTAYHAAFLSPQEMPPVKAESLSKLFDDENLHVFKEDHTVPMLNLSWRTTETVVTIFQENCWPTKFFVILLLFTLIQAQLFQEGYKNR